MRSTRNIIVATGALTIVGHAAVLAQEEEDRGKIAFNTHCRQCHSMRKGDNRLGPSLHGIFGAKAGQVKGYPAYSGSLQENITWDDATLDEFIADSKSFTPGTNMIYPGVADASERKKIIEYLRAKNGP